MAVDFDRWTEARRTAFVTQRARGSGTAWLSTKTRLRWRSRIGRERALFELAAAVRAYREIAPSQLTERVAPRLKTFDVDARLLGARALQGVARPLQLGVGRTCVETVVPDLLEAFGEYMLQKAA